MSYILSQKEKRKEENGTKLHQKIGGLHCVHNFFFKFLSFAEAKVPAALCSYDRRSRSS